MMFTFRALSSGPKKSMRGLVAVPFRSFFCDVLISTAADLVWIRHRSADGALDSDAGRLTGVRVNQWLRRLAYLLAAPFA
jgi:hypothetical protein